MNSPISQSTKVFPKFENQIDSSDLRCWTSKHLYRTSTLDMSKTAPQKSKVYAIPGYQGTIPGVKSDNNFGKTFTKISREQLSRQVYLPNKTLEFFPNRPMVQTAFGRTQGKFGGGLEDEYQTISRFHGHSTLSKEHPNYISDPWTTTNKTEFKPQEPIRKHIFRTTHTEKWKKSQHSLNEATKSSGFVNNWLICDGNGWLPIKEMHGDMTNTEYRKRFNNEVPFHPDPLKSVPRKLKKKNVVY